MDLPPLFDKSDNFCDWHPVCFPTTPFGSKFFPFRLDSVSEENKYNFIAFPPLRRCLLYPLSLIKPEGVNLCHTWDFRTLLLNMKPPTHEQRRISNDNMNKRHKVCLWKQKNTPKIKKWESRFYIAKTRLFKYIENFTSKNWKFLDKRLGYFFIFLLKT